MNRILYFFAFLCFCTTTSVAQYGTNQNKVWTFGNRAGVDFTSGSPVSFTSAIITSEGCASVCNSTTGALLFYTDGVKVWNAGHVVMPTGGAIVSYGASSTTQGSLIVPFVGDPNKYYVFSLEQVGGGVGHCRLSYSVVDMSLDGGLGDVVSTRMGIRIDSFLGEKMTAIAGNSCNIWVLTHHKDTTKFLAFEVTAAGVNLTPVVSNIGTRLGVNSNAVGVMKGSPNRLMVATQCYSYGSRVGTELYDFNPTTGVLSNCRLLDSTNSQYGAEFSPDNTKLYANRVGGALLQYDVTLGTAAAIRASAYTVASSISWKDLKLAPDGKIYFISTSGTSLDCINNPNVAGAGCGYITSAVSIAPNSGNGGLPNIIYAVSGGGDTTDYMRHDTTVCIPVGGTIRIRAHDTGTGYAWSDGRSGYTRTVSAYGRYICAISSGCDVKMDTINVLQIPPDTIYGRRDTVVCGFATSVTINARPGYGTYTWYDGSTGTSHTVSAAGNYWVVGSDSCLNALVDTVRVTFALPDTTINPTRDTTVCITASPFTLRATTGLTTYTWSTGGTADTLRVIADGTYYSTGVLNCSVTIDTFRIAFISQPIVDLGNDTAFCIGMSLLLHSTQPAGSDFLWNTGTTDTSLLVSTTDVYWLRVDNGYCQVTDTIRVTISPYPIVNLGPDTLNCTGTPIPLISSYTYGSHTLPTYLWSDGSTTPGTTAIVTGTYWLQVTVGNCPNADTIRVTIHHDTFTLYNMDTAICRGQSVQALLTANPDATFQWLPTAGVAASRTASPLITPDTSADYHVMIYLEGCAPLEDSFYLDVQPLPVPYFGNNRFVCSNDTLQLAALVNPGWYTDYVYRWRPGGEVNDSTAQSVIYKPNGAPMDTTLMELWVSTTAGCTGSVSSKIYVYPGEFATVSNNLSVCPHEEAQFTATGGATYQWSPDLYLDDAQSATPWVRAITSQRYTVLATSPYGCKEQLQVEVIVHPGAMMYLGDSVTLYPGEQYHINPQTNCTQFEWTPSAGLSSAFVQDPMASPTSSTQYIVTGTTEYGCKIVDTLNIRVEADGILDVPNAFAPGGNNKEFRVLRKGDATLNYFRVYNRWGNLVFETTDISKGWDGTYKGVPQPMGVFVYDVQAVTSAGTLFSKHGNVTLIR